VDVLVTGGAGFIGSNLVRCLMASGDRVRVLDDLSSGSEDNLRDGIEAPELIVGDIRDPRVADRAARGVEVVHHLAAVTVAHRRAAEPSRMWRVNVDGTVNVLRAARDAGVRRVVYASVAPEPRTPAAGRALRSRVPAPRYLDSKLEGERRCRVFARSGLVETVSLRLSDTFGPRQNPSSPHAAVVPRLLSLPAGGPFPLLPEDRHERRDLNYVANVIQACLLAALAGDEAVGESVAIGSGTRLSVTEMIVELNDLLGRTRAPLQAAPRPERVPDLPASLDRPRRLLGYRPLVDLRQGLAHTLDWLARRERDPGRPERRWAPREVTMA
jgi:nucleoside-diphosphate-sugar epimerase